MALTEQQKKLAIAIVVVIAILVIGFFGYRYWEKHHGSAGSFHGVRHYPPQPYAGKSYYMGAPYAPRRDKFSGDLDGWPTATTFGNLPDTNPYGNYAGHVDMYWPTYLEGAYQDMYWTYT